jgi:transcriptional regulator with XRE-family HTH domain
MDDNALMQAIGSFVRHHRLEQNKSQESVAHSAGISRSTLSLLEKGDTVTLPTLIQVLRVLDLLYIMDAFKVIENISPLVLLKQQKQKRKRAGN